MKKVVIVLLKISHFIHNPCHHTVEINRCRFIYQKDKKKKQKKRDRNNEHFISCRFGTSS